MSPDGEALLRAVREAPGDDLPRLAYADWLEEGGEGGRGRAAFIRLQFSREARDLRLARRALGACFPEWWLPGWGWRPLRPYGPPRKQYAVDLAPPGALAVRIFGPRGVELTWRRGWVDEALLPASVWEEYCGRLFCTHPVTRVSFTDRHPQDRGDLGWYWAWYGGATSVEGRGAAELPRDVFARLPPTRWHNGKGKGEAGAAVYDSEAEARAALSAACVEWGRHCAGLPPLGGAT